MKRTFILLFVILFLPFYGELNANSVKDGDVISIPLKEGDNDEDSKNNPRSIFTPSIYCYYSIGTFQFIFHETFEDVYIRVENISTGERWTKSMDLSAPSVKITTSATNGNYIISISADSRYYYGQFQK